MKFIGITTQTSRRVAAVSDDQVVDLAAVDEFWADAALWRERAAARLAGGTAEAPGGTEPAKRIRLADVTQAPLIPASARVLCVGLNYRAHAAEGSFEVPEYPTIFGRWTASLSVGGVAAPVPDGEAGLDWEGEIAAVVGRRIQNADERTAAQSVFGYATFNDLTCRRAQKLTAQWTLGKNGDRSGPMGPLVTADEVGDLRDGLQVRTRVNGVEVQNGNTRDMIFSVGHILSLVSRTMTLHPGDVLVSGTPEGVGYVRTPPWLLQPGDTVEVEVDRLGTLVTPIAGPDARADA
ncbi:fumarylacetoacetate hydrolase family protein [Microbacterium sp. STN6]|uniref:fumarylacetoacetate hydrolase family protein n=1 Tax=Microbacterium sp. STN6 TaxID=2995588 RepID=UPI0022609133|nr:fumarylacetoacetate hydrolase family protein [Microbacterium sp. STN6]MCX7520777.1 fumarylacetoacetate hydrolase family protein [Microbacterium sp. STN6]